MSERMNFSEAEYNNGGSSTGWDGPFPEFKGNTNAAESEAKIDDEPKFDADKTIISVYDENRGFGLAHSGLNLEMINAAPDSVKDAVAFEFNTPLDENVDTKTYNVGRVVGLNDALSEAVASKTDNYDRHLYFVGETKGFDDIKDVFIDPNEAAKEYSEKDFAVLYDNDGKISSIKVIDEDVVGHPVKDKEALRQAYQKVTGTPLPVAS